MKIVVCGGHLAPALAIIENLRENKKYNVYYIGRKNALEGDEALSLEYITINKLGVPFKSITTGRLQRTLTRHTLPSLIKFPASLIGCFFYLLNLRPNVVLSFGGYVALPVCLAAWILRIPIITHEQTKILGLANKIICRLSDVLCLSFDDTKGLPKGINSIYTGNPIRRSIFKDKDERLTSFGDETLPLLYITGGNLGARSINRVFEKLVPRLTYKFRILHQCGSADRETDFKRLSILKESLSPKYKENYQVIKHVNPFSVGAIYQNASLIISRAGANTVTEILTFGLPAILIPLPWAGQNEQEKNANLIKSLGLGEVVLQSDLSEELLSDTIKSMMSNLNRYIKNKTNAYKSMKWDADTKLLKLIDRYL